MSDALLQRLASLEAELAQLRQRKPAEPDPSAFRSDFVRDPVGMYKRMGLTPDEVLHIQRVNFAHAMGDQAPPQLQALAAMGPQVAQTSALTSAVESLSRRFDELSGERKEEVTRSSVRALLTDKSKYPHLSVAAAADSAFFENRIKGRAGTPDEIAQQLEEEAAQFAKLYGYKPAQTASVNADENTDAQSTESKPATTGGASIEAPPLSGLKGGPLTAEEDAKIKQHLIRKYGLQP